MLVLLWGGFKHKKIIEMEPGTVVTFGSHLPDPVSGITEEKRYYIKRFIRNSEKSESSYEVCYIGICEDYDMSQFDFNNVIKQMGSSLKNIMEVRTFDE